MEFATGPAVESGGYEDEEIAWKERVGFAIITLPRTSRIVKKRIDLNC